jgi:HSP20 family protein
MKLMRYNQPENQYPTTFSSMLDRFFNDTVQQSLKKFIPAVDISEDEGSYQILVSVPGMRKADFEIEIRDGRLEISGERKLEEKTESKNYHALETQYGHFQRSFYLPDDVDPEKIHAKYEDGLLKLNLPKVEKKVNKSKIEVK